MKYLKIYMKYLKIYMKYLKIYMAGGPLGAIIFLRCFLSTGGADTQIWQHPAPGTSPHHILPFIFFNKINKPNNIIHNKTKNNQTSPFPFNLFFVS